MSLNSIKIIHRYPEIPSWGISFFCFILIMGLISCENDIEVINNITNVKDLPSISANNIKIFYTDSGKLKLKIIAGEINQFNIVDEPYIDFPSGIHVMFFDSLENVESEIISEYAIYYNNKEFWEARKNVIARNLKTGEQLNTEVLYWDQGKKIVYSDKFCKITNKEGVFYGEGGFKADQSLTKWKLIGSKGTVNINEE